MSAVAQVNDWGRRLDHFVARGVCGWCATPFLRPVEYVKDWGHLPIRYCRKACSTAARDKRRQIRDHAVECPTRHKQVFLNERLAQHEADHRDVPDDVRLRVYHCTEGCRGWHLTKKEPLL